ncbi:MAG: glycerophosphodiester phosphodiesterase [Rhizobiales bacterium]|nr:glycerophosphodiester phosphodiesterase [Hyphomicrobiales bacterium]
MRFTPELRRLDWLVARPIAHRGLHDKAEGVLENTAAAFAEAVDHGYAIECDLQLSRDGEAMIFHDDTLERLTDATGPVIARPASELQKVAFKNSPARMQTLAEMLDQVAGRATLVIEIKSLWNGDNRLADRALSVLETYEGPCALMSFDPDIIAHVRERSPLTVRGIVADRTTDAYYAHLPLERRLELRSLSHADRTRPHFVSFCAAELPFEPVTRLRAAGLPIISWTIRTREQARHARRYSDQITFEGFAA